MTSSLSSRSAWHRLAPIALDDPVLRSVEECLDAKDTQDELARLERAEQYPAPVLARLRAAGLARILDRERLTAWHLNALNELAARRDASLAITLGVHSLALIPLAVAAPEELTARILDRVREGARASFLLTELENGSNLLRNKTRATSLPPPLAGEGRGGGYLVTGEKHLINGGIEHELLVTLARTKDPAPDAEGPLAAAGDFTLLVVERDATVESLPRWRTLPARGADISGVRFNGTRVPEANRIGAEGEGFSIVGRTLTITRGGISSLACGTSARAFDLALEHARTRDVYGSPIITLGAIAGHLAELEARHLLACALSVKATAFVNALGLAAAPITAAAKVACCALAEEAVLHGRRILGARALLREHPYERLNGDVLLFGVFDGTSHVMLEQVQWDLARQSQRASDSTDILAELGKIYRTPPRSLCGALRGGRVRPFTLSLLDEARALARVPGRDLSMLVGLVEELLRVTRELRREGGPWETDQALRFDAAETFARLEALIALVEWADPDRRVALGLSRIEEPAYEFAFASGGAELCARVRRVALSAGVESGRLEEIERGFLGAVLAERKKLGELYRSSGS